MKVTREDKKYLVHNDNDQLILIVYTSEMIIPKDKYQEETLCIIDKLECISDDNDVLLEALKTAYMHLRNDQGYKQYPGIDNYYRTLDDKERFLYGVLIDQGYIPRQQLMNTDDAVGDLNVQNKTVMKNLIGSTTVPRSDFSYSGYLPQNHTLVYRAPRSFAKERFSQVLRQMATQIYNFLRVELDPIEVQIMYLNNSLFISANTRESVAKMHKDLSTQDALKQALTSTYKHKAVDAKASSRHAAKLLSRLYNDYACDDPRFSKLKAILNREIRAIPIDSNNKNAIQGEGNIYFVSYKLKADRHAEENLMDVLEMFIPDFIYDKSKPAIFGKKRPCFNCHARLEGISRNLAEEFNCSSPSFEFNPFKGLLFKGAAEMQLKNSASAAASAYSLGKYSHNIYVSEIGGHSYATGSDTEYDNCEDEEEEDKLSSKTSKLSLKNKSLS